VQGTARSRRPPGPPAAVRTAGDRLS
jgi:hypothetical protein